MQRFETITQEKYDMKRALFLCFRMLHIVG